MNGISSAVSFLGQEAATSMILRCCYCEGLLKVDENSLPLRGPVKIRCPHCRKIGHMPNLPLPAPPPATGLPEGDREQRAYHRLLPLEDFSRPPSEKDEPSIPPDAFHDFRFPAEGESPPQGKKPMGRGLKIALWILVSLGVIGFFALLVNIILPGPSGVQRVIHTMPGGDPASPEIPQPDVGRGTHGGSR